MNEQIEHRDQRPTSTVRRGLAIGLAGGLLAGTAAGVAFGVPGLTNAASESSTATPAAVVQQVEAPERGERLREALQPLVADGTISAEQADAVTAHLVEQLPERGDGPGRSGHDRPGHRVGWFAAGVASEALTDLLGIDARELRTQLRDGTTLAEIAEAQGVDVSDVVDVLVAEVEERLDNAVERGRIDQERADRKLADATERITDLVTNGRPGRGPAAGD
jgi:hypothetical protein